MKFNSNEQLNWQPEIINLKPLTFDNVVVGGMGGSAMPARAMFYIDSTYPLWLHNDYGLPKKFQDKTLFVAISYSGNTAETLSFAKEAYERGLPLVIITSGGALKSFAEKEALAHVLVPEGHDPRDVLIYLLKALFLVLGKEFGEVSLDTDKALADGQRLSEAFRDYIPLIYASTENAVLAYIWKAFTNESGKVPAFANTFPELTHNEIEAVNELGGKFKVLTIESDEDDQRIHDRMGKFKEFLTTRGQEAVSFPLSGRRIDNLLATWITARFFAHALAAYYGVDPSAEPSITAFKKL